MSFIVILSVLCFIIGVLVYAVSGNPTVKEIGRAMMWCGLLASLYYLGARQIKGGL